MAAKFFREAVAWQKHKGYVVHHETHRKRFLYSPWVARDFVPRYWNVLGIGQGIKRIYTGNETLDIPAIAGIAGLFKHAIKC